MLGGTVADRRRSLCFSQRPPTTQNRRPVAIALISLHVLFSALLILLILLHRGAGGGLSDMFGGGGASAQGSAVVEKNLDRLTVLSGLGFTITTIALGLVL
jgi:preprotein translocase subunit SecG